MRRNGARPHWIILDSRIPAAFGHDAFTFAFWTFVAAPYCSAELRAHENRHVQQLLRWWILGFWLAYLGEYLIRIVLELARGNVHSTLKRAYHRLSFERDAYRWASANWQAFDAVRRR